MRFPTVIFTIFALSACSSLLAQGHENIEFISQIYDRWETADGIVVVNETAFIATHSTGMQILDISDPENPELLGMCENLSGPARKIAIQGEGAYIAAGAYGEGGIYVVDISEPDNPFIRGYHPVDDFTSTIAVRNNFVFVNDGLTLKVFDVMNLDDIRNIHTIRSVYPFDMVIVDTTLYMADFFAGLRIYNISNPRNVSQIGDWGNRMDFSSTIAVQEDRAFITERAHYLYVLDISDPTDPVSIDTCLVYGGRDIAVKDSFAYVANNGGLKIVSVLTDSGAYLAAEYDTGWDRGYGSGIALADDYAYFTASIAGLIVLDISNPTDPREIGDYNRVGAIRSVTYAGEYLYVADGLTGIKIVDVENMNHPVEVGTAESPGSALDIAVVDTIAYIADGFGLRTFDVSDPENPEMVGGHDINGINSIAVSEEYAYTAGGTGFWVFDVFNPRDPIRLNDRLNIEGRGRTLAIRGDYAYIVDDEGGGNLHIIDITTPWSPRFITTYNPRGTAYDIAIEGNLAYVVGTRELAVLDLSNPRAPESIGSFRLEQSGVSVTVEDDHAYVGQGYAGFQVFDVSDPENIVECGFYDTPGYAAGIAAQGDIAYVADYAHLEIYDCSEALTVDVTPRSLPYSFSISSIHPNPFNSNTTINYNIPLALRVTINIFDISGRLVETLYDDFQTVGHHSVVWDSREFGSGIYLMQLQTKTGNKVAKLVAIK